MRAAKSIRYQPAGVIRSGDYPLPITDEDLLSRVKGYLVLVKKTDGKPTHIESGGEVFFIGDSDIRFLICEGYVYALREYPDGNSIGTVIGEAPERLSEALRLAAWEEDGRVVDTELHFIAEVIGYGNDTLLVRVTDALDSNLAIGEELYVPSDWEGYPRGTTVSVTYNGVVEVDEDGNMGLGRTISVIKGSIRTDPGSMPYGAFSFAEVLANYPEGTPGAKYAGFVNTDAAPVEGFMEAAERAKSEATIDYDRLQIWYDEGADVWAVNFFSSTPSGDETVYLGGDGVTKLIVYGE